MSDRGSLCFAVLPIPDSEDRGGNEVGVEGVGAVDLSFLLHQFLSLAP